MSGTMPPHFSLKGPQDATFVSQKHAYQGPTRNVRLPKVCSNGGGAIAKAPEGQKCVVAGKESLRIIRIFDSPQQEDSSAAIYRVTGRGGYRVEASKNLWEGSGLKVDSAFTDTAWCHGPYSNKILTSARNGELIMWDLNKTGSTKYERRAKDHLRSINTVQVSLLVPNYCLTGSSDGDLRVWDIRDLRKSIIRIHHPTGVRGVVFSPVVFQPLQAVVGLDNGNIFRWDLKIGQRGRLDRIPVAHTGSVTTLDWCSNSGNTSESTGNGHGWIVSGGLDRCVKVWDLTRPGPPHGHIPHKPTYTLHTSFPVRHVRWRPSFDCEIAIVSNGDFGSGSNADMSTPTIPMTALGTNLHPPPSTTSRMSPNVGLGLDLDSTPVPRPKSYSAVVASGTVTSPATPRITMSGSNSGAGDTAEIWDVRRGWIAKWQITGSAAEGGLSDLCFGGDAHVAWGQHFSGMFSQIDLRDVTKPIDAIGRVAVDWEAGGGLTFVADRKETDEVPYDDMMPDGRSAFEGSKTVHKSLGDSPFIPVSQNVGSFQTAELMNDTAVFTKLAEEYVLEGEDRRDICAVNAQAAIDAGQYRTAQVWLLVEASLANLITEGSQSQSRLQSAVQPPISMSQSYSVSAAISSMTALDKTNPGRLSDHSSERVNSPNSYQQLSGGRKTFYTPSSSTNTSPRQNLSGLPPTPITHRFSQFGRRNSIDPATFALTPPPLNRRPSAHRRPSNSTHSASPSTSSLRHVGEGALDDSDSSSSGEEEDEDGFEDDSVGRDPGHEEEEPTALRPLVSPALGPLRVSHPSPLSRVASRRWTDGENETDGKEEEDEASPSPRSTDSEGDGKNIWSSSTSKRKRPASNRRSSGVKLKTRGRSSTLASLQTMSSRQSSTKSSLLRHDSLASIKTVTASAADVSVKDFEDQPPSKIRSDEASKDLRHTKHSRDKSLAISELVLADDGDHASVREPALSCRNQELITADEERYRDIVWVALRESVDLFADEGDVQLCAMLAILVPDELGMRQRRRLAFIESYIDRLSRLRLHVCAAYVRKYSNIDDVRSLTLLETTIYTACGRCRKPFIISPSQAARSGYTYCPRCRRTTSICSICRLPVHGILFQCSVCAHGGHQVCYQRFYAQRAMVHVPHSIVLHEPSPSNTSSENETIASTRTSLRSTFSSRASIDTTASTTSTSTTTTEEDGVSTCSTLDASSEGGTHMTTTAPHLVGRPCAAGCGHYCWVAKVTGTSDI
ncbi:hypothetical protein E1B28_011566 [Marasmius oreades]|uniref:WD repeat-containing protein 24 n=1 Tax=Marasmius oreades TaxID=181124 RepID=A0A9P7RUC4_9AGAR|nr:uncharacterized protein E1B28_011566 [Marasmius oreades]KAG7089936.1 hypothetical protein E1B28_011566 [Marasmius oreades]